MLEKAIEEATVRFLPPTLEERIQHTVEKATLSEWLNVMKSGAKMLETARRMSWADDDDNVQVTNNSPVVTISADGIQEEIEYWSSAVICYVLGANLPLTVMDGYFRRIWGKLGIDKIAMVGRGISLVKFINVEVSLKVPYEGF